MGVSKNHGIFEIIPFVHRVLEPLFSNHPFLEGLKSTPIFWVNTQMGHFKKRGVHFKEAGVSWPSHNVESNNSND